MVPLSVDCESADAGELPLGRTASATDRGGASRLLGGISEARVYRMAKGVLRAAAGHVGEGKRHFDPCQVERSIDEATVGQAGGAGAAPLKLLLGAVGPYRQRCERAANCKVNTLLQFAD